MVSLASLDTRSILSELKVSRSFLVARDCVLSSFASIALGSRDRHVVGDGPEKLLETELHTLSDVFLAYSL